MDAPRKTALPIYACPICGFPHDTDETGKIRKPECQKRAQRDTSVFNERPRHRVRDRAARRRREYGQRLAEGFWMLSEGYMPHVPTPDA